MTELHEALGDIAAEITPIDPPVDLTMRRGRRRRSGRLAAVAAGVIALVAGAVFAIPGRADHQGDAAGPAPAAGHPVDRAPLVRPVLLEAIHGSAHEYGDAHLVDAATLRLFHRLSCEPGPTAFTFSDSWKVALGYTAEQWNAPGSEVVSCDAYGNKYVLGKAAITGTRVTSATPVRQANTAQWTVKLTFDDAGTRAWSALITRLSHAYSAAEEASVLNAVTLGSAAVVLDGNVLSVPLIGSAIISGQFTVNGGLPSHFTRAEATALAARLWARSLRPVRAAVLLLAVLVVEQAGPAECVGHRAACRGSRGAAAVAGAGCPAPAVIGVA
jgi:hypothetical protein